MNSLYKRRLPIIGSFYFIAYFIAAITLYKERLFLDGAYYFFNVLQNNDFWVEHQRFILIPSQFLTWAGIQFQFPLQQLMLLNSINPVLYLFILFIVCLFLFKDEVAAWALLLLGVCGVYFLFFCPMYEVWYGAALLIVFSSMLHQKFYEEYWQLLILAGVCITLLFSYPLMIFGFLFFSSYHFADIKKVRWSVVAVIAVSILVWVLWKYFFISDYENGKISYPWSQMRNIVKENLGSLSNWVSLLKFLFSVYGEEMIAFLVVLGILCFRKNYLKAALTGCFVTGFILLINFTQNTPWIHSNYYERMYLLLVPLCLVPFLREVYASSKFKMIIELVLVGVIFFRGAQIMVHSSFYVDRIQSIEELVHVGQEQGGSKYFVEEKNYPGNTALNEWSFPMETLLFSSPEKKAKTITISLKSDLAIPEVAHYLNSSTFHLRLNEVMGDQTLNGMYFNLDHDSYRELNRK